MHYGYRCDRCKECFIKQCKMQLYFCTDKNYWWSEIKAVSEKNRDRGIPKYKSTKCWKGNLTSTRLKNIWKDIF